MLLPILAGCGKKEEEKPAAPQTITLGPEDVVTVTQGEIESGPEINGTLTAEREAVLRSQITGSVLAVTVQPGEAVRKGQTLARLDSAALSEAYSSARSAVTSARSNLELARRQADRQRVLVEAGAVARREVETAEQAVVAAGASLAQAQAGVAGAREQLSNTSVTAPFAGVVSERPVSVGDVVQPGTALLTVVDPSSLELAASVPAEALGNLRIGSTVDLAISGFHGRLFRGLVTRINPSADPTTRQVRVYAEVPNQGNELVSGLYAEGRVASERRTGLLLPSAAIDRRTPKPAVLAVRDGKVARIEVQLGLVDDREQRVEVTGGVRNGDIVLQGPAQNIQPGTPVQLPQPAQPRLAEAP